MLFELPPCLGHGRREQVFIGVSADVDRGLRQHPLEVRIRQHVSAVDLPHADDCRRALHERLELALAIVQGGFGILPALDVLGDRHGPRDELSPAPGQDDFCESPAVQRGPGGAGELCEAAVVMTDASVTIDHDGALADGLEERFAKSGGRG
jgi:hypothetical protein